MAKRSNTRWNAEEDKRLLEFHAAGKSRPAIAAALRRSAKSIPSRLYVLGKLNRPAKVSKQQVE